MSRPLVLVILSCLSISAGALAEEFPGGSTPTQMPTDEEFEQGFGEKTGLTSADREGIELDRLKLGGMLWNELLYSRLSASSSVGRSAYFSNPNSLWLYLDARLKDDVRGFVKLREIYDPTPATGKSTTDLEELKLQFTLKKRVFFTVGKQKIKWGSGKFWNPTDFLNEQTRNFFYSQDLRSGVTLIKAHMPVGASNFYLIEKLDDAHQPAGLGHAMRAEVPIEASEIAASALLRNGRDPQFGLDVSTALWELDGYAEFAYSGGNRKTFYSRTGSATAPDRDQTAWTVGLNYEAIYQDKDSMVFALEYFNQALGYTDPAVYPTILAAGAYSPFYLSRHYGMFMVQLPKPGTWNDVTFTLFNLVNLTDRSAMSRVESLIDLYEDLQLNLAVGVHYGEGNGEFKQGGQSFDLASRLMIVF